jgi:hypothetical protein
MDARAMQLLEAFALEKVEFTGAGRSGPVSWTCRGCIVREGFGRIGGRYHERVSADLIHWSAKSAAFEAIPHAPDCQVAEALAIVQRARKEAA